MRVHKRIVNIVATAATQRTLQNGQFHNTSYDVNNHKLNLNRFLSFQILSVQLIYN